MSRAAYFGTLILGSLVLNGVAVADEKTVCVLAVGDQDEGGWSAIFEECSGIGSEHEIIEHKVMTASGQEVVKKIPGRLKYHDIVLKKGLTDNGDLWAWRHEIETAGISTARQNGSLSIVDHGGDTIARWEFLNGWPSKAKAQESDDVDGNGIEEMTLIVEYLERVE